MGDKIIYVTWAIIVLVMLGVIYFIVEPLFGAGGMAWFHVYARAFLALMVIQAFAILRLYNSIVQNTRFIIKMRESVVKLQQSLPTLERIMRQLTTALGTLKSSVDADKKAHEKATDKLQSKIRKDA